MQAIQANALPPDESAPEPAVRNYFGDMAVQLRQVIRRAGGLVQFKATMGAYVAAQGLKAGAGDSIINAIIQFLQSPQGQQLMAALLSLLIAAISGTA